MLFPKTTRRAGFTNRPRSPNHDHPSQVCGLASSKEETTRSEPRAELHEERDGRARSQDEARAPGQAAVLRREGAHRHRSPGIVNALTTDVAAAEIMQTPELLSGDEQEFVAIRPSPPAEPDQNGRPLLARQRIRRTALAVGQIRGTVPAAMRYLRRPDRPAHGTLSSLITNTVASHGAGAPNPDRVFFENCLNWPPITAHPSGYLSGLTYLNFLGRL